MIAAYKMYQRKSGIVYIVNAFGRIVYLKNKGDESYWRVPKTNLKLNMNEVEFVQDLTANELILELL